MKILVDNRPKKNRAILDNVVQVPDNLTARQKQALSNLRQLLKYELEENV